MDKYYKILSDNLFSYGFQYKEGLNTDIHDINSTECNYGLHYTPIKHIFRFLDYGTKIAEVSVPEDAIVYNYKDKSKSNKIVLSNIRDLWNIETIKDLVENGANIHEHDDYALKYASYHGYLDIVKYLVENGADIHINNEYPLRYAIYNKHEELIDYLLSKGANIHIDNDYLIKWIRIEKEENPCRN